MTAALHPLDNTIEFDFDYDRVLLVGKGDSRDGARVRYRKVGTRRWTRFLLVGDEGETLQAVDAKIEPAILAHAERWAR